MDRTKMTPTNQPARPRRRTVLQAMLAGLGAINAREALADAGQSAVSATATAPAPAAIAYILQVLAGGMLAHVYWGRRLQSASWPGMRNGHEDDAPPAHADLGDRNFSPNTQPQEFPGYGTGDFRLARVTSTNSEPAYTEIRTPSQRSAEDSRLT